MLAAMAICGGLIMLDETVVGVALPTLRRELGMTQLTSHWVISIYMLVFACCAAAAGRLGDVVGFRTLLLGGAALFAVGSLGCGLSHSGTVLIVSRAVQGLGAAAIFPVTVALIMVSFPQEQRGMAMGTLAAVGTTFLAVGPLVGGFLSEVVSWRWIFWVNIPVVAAATAIVLVAWTEEPREQAKQPPDLIGLGTLVGGLTLLVIAIMQGSNVGWTSWSILGAFVGGLAFLVVLTFYEYHHDTPLIDVGLFRSPSFIACNFIVFSGQFAKITIVVFVALYFQEALGMKPLTAGVALLLAVAGFPFLSIYAGRLADRTGARTLVLTGQAVATCGMFWIAFSAGLDGLWYVAPGLVIWGLGMPLVYPPTLRALANSVPKEKQGQVGGIGVTFRLLGGTIGAALGSAVLLASSSFQSVFLCTGLLMLSCLILGWFAIAADERTKKPTVHHRVRLWGHS
ncbi:MAG: MFS transporter [Pseudomonadota bacterium]